MSENTSASRKCMMSAEATMEEETYILRIQNSSVHYDSSKIKKMRQPCNKERGDVSKQYDKEH